MVNGDLLIVRSAGNKLNEHGEKKLRLHVKCSTELARVVGIDDES